MRKYLQDHIGKILKIKLYNDDVLKTPFLPWRIDRELPKETLAPFTQEGIFFDETFSSVRCARLEKGSQAAHVDMNICA